MAPEPQFETMCFNLFLANDALNDSNQSPDVNFYNDISSLESNYYHQAKLIKTSTNFLKNHFLKYGQSLNNKFSIICLTETWVNDSKIKQSSLFQLEGYIAVHQIRKSRKGGGIIIFIQNSLLCKLCNDLSINCEDIESLSIEILNSLTRNIIFNVIYRPPNGNLNVCETFFKKNPFKLVLQLTKLFFLAGDFNINLLDFETNKKVQSFVNLMFQFSMIPTINKSTRAIKQTATAIDNITTNCIMNSGFKSAIVKMDLPDHFPIIFINELM